MTSMFDALAEAEDGAYAVDMQQRLIFWNAAAQRILGYTAGDVLGRPCFHVLCGRGEEGGECARNCGVILRARRGGVAPCQTMAARAKDGTIKWLSVMHVLLPRDGAKEPGLIHLFHDSTEDVQAREFMRRLSGLLGQRRKDEPLPIEPPEPAPQGGRDLRALTPREREVLALLTRGASTKAIAASLVVSQVTARNHVQRVLAKLDVHSRLEAAAVARRALD